MLVVNLWGGPGSGKSTLLHRAMAEAKMRGLRVEACMEYAKDIVYDRDWEKLKDQEHILDEQHARLARLDGQVDFAIIDAPLLNGLNYSEGATRVRLRARARPLWDRFDNVSLLLGRCVPYHNEGRYQDEAGAVAVDAAVAAMLAEEDIAFTAAAGDRALAVVMSWMGLDGTLTVTGMS